MISAGYTIASWSLLMRVEILRERLGISTSGNAFAAFMAATAGINFGAVLGLLLQPVLLASVSRLHRACIGLALQALANAMFLVAFFCTAEPLTKSIWVVALGFTSVGFARTVSETNSQTLMAAYGADAQRFLVLGNNASWSGAGVVFFTLQAIFGNTYVLGGLFHFACASACVIAIIALMRLPSPDEPTGCADDDEAQAQLDADDSMPKTMQDMRLWRLWLPPISARLAVSTLVCAVNMFVTAMGQLLYSRNGQALIPGLVISPSIFMLLFCTIETAGGALGVAIVQHLKRPNMFGLSVMVLGVVLVLSRVPLLAVLSSGVITVGESTSNAVATVAIATEAPRRYTLTAMLLLCFLMQVTQGLAQASAGPWAVIVGPVHAT